MNSDLTQPNEQMKKLANEFQTRPNEQADEKVGPNEFQTQPNEQKQMEKLAK
jgi:hypothetical protein